MQEKNLEKYRQLEPVSRVLRALAIPPPEVLIPTPKEIMNEMGVPTPEDILPPVKEKITANIVRTLRRH